MESEPSIVRRVEKPLRRIVTKTDTPCDFTRTSSFHAQYVISLLVEKIICLFTFQWFMKRIKSLVKDVA